VRIPSESGHPFRREGGHHSDVKAATDSEAKAATHSDVKAATDSEAKAATHSDVKAATF
jgi:hypothetical protein